MPTRPRDTYKYKYVRGGKILHGGITNNLERRENEHQQKWPGGRIRKVGRRTTRDGAQEWERRNGY